MIQVRIPAYRTPKTEWRREIYSAVADEMQRQGVRYDASDKLEVNVRFYMNEPQLSSLDVDNRLKSVLDALQGFVSKGKGWKKRGWPSLIPNESDLPGGSGKSSSSSPEPQPRPLEDP